MNHDEHRVNILELSREQPDPCMPKGVTASAFFRVASLQRLWVKRRVFSHRLREDGCNHTRISLDFDIPDVLLGAKDRSAPATIMVPLTLWSKDRQAHRIDFRDGHGAALRLVHSDTQVRLVMLQVFAFAAEDLEHMTKHDVRLVKEACRELVTAPKEQARHHASDVDRTLESAGVDPSTLKKVGKFLEPFVKDYLVAVLLTVPPGAKAGMVKYSYGLGSGEMAPYKSRHPLVKWIASLAPGSLAWQANPRIEIIDRDSRSAATTHYELEVTGEVLLRAITVFEGVEPSSSVYDSESPLERARSIAVVPRRVPIEDALLDDDGKEPSVETRVRAVVVPKASSQTTSARVVSRGAAGVAWLLAAISFAAWAGGHTLVQQWLSTAGLDSAYAWLAADISPQVDSGALQLLVTAAAAGSALISREPEHAVTSWALRPFRTVARGSAWCLAWTAGITALVDIRMWWAPLIPVAIAASYLVWRDARAAHWIMPRGREITHTEVPK